MRFLILSSLALALALAGRPVAAQAVADASPPGYLMVTGWYKDLGVQRAYTGALTDVIRQYGYQGAVIGMPGTNLRLLEGDWAPRFMILARFPSDAQVKQFWWSEAYQEVKKIRAGQAYLDVVEVDGIEGSEPRMHADAAYLVFFAALEDRETFIRDYAPHAPAVVAEYGGHFLVRAGRGDIELLEGDWLNASLVVVEFPSQQALRAFWSSERYQALSGVRRATGKWSVIEIVPQQR